MRSAFLLHFVVAVSAGAGQAASPAPSIAHESFAADVAPVLQRHCVACHGPEKAKGHFRLDTYAGLMKPGTSDKPSVVPGQPEASHLYQLIVEKNEDDRMPQKAEPLTAAEMSVIRAWIADGAKFDGPSTTAPLVSFLPKPAHPPAPQHYTHAWPVTAVTFKPDGSQLVVGGYREITFWNVTNQTLVRRAGGMPERIHSLSWQPGGSLVAIAGGAPGRSGEVLLFDTATNQPPLDLTVTGDEMLCTAFSSDGQRLAAGGADKILRVFSVKSGTEILKLEQHSDWVHGVVFSPDGGMIASASRDRTARVYNSTNGETISIFRGHDAAVESLVFSKDGKLVLSAGADRVVRSWDSADAGHSKTVAKFDVAITALSRADQSVFIALADGRVVQYRVPERDNPREFTGTGDRVTALAFHEASQLLAIGTHGGRVWVWNLSDGSLVSDFTASPGFIPTTGR